MPGWVWSTQVTSRRSVLRTRDRLTGDQHRVQRGAGRVGEQPDEHPGRGPGRLRCRVVVLGDPARVVAVALSWSHSTRIRASLAEVAGLRGDDAGHGPLLGGRPCGHPVDGPAAGADAGRGPDVADGRQRAAYGLQDGAVGRPASPSTWLRGSMQCSSQSSRNSRQSSATGGWRCCSCRSAPAAARAGRRGPAAAPRRRAPGSRAASSGQVEVPSDAASRTAGPATPAAASTRRRARTGRWSAPRTGSTARAARPPRRRWAR